MTIPDVPFRTATAPALALLALLVIVSASLPARAGMTEQEAKEKVDLVESGPLARSELTTAESDLQAVADACLDCTPELQARVWVLLGVIDAVRGNREKAADSFRRALTLDPMTPLGELYAQDSNTLRLFEKIRDEVTDAFAGKPAPGQEPQPGEKPAPSKTKRKAPRTPRSRPAAAPAPSPFAPPLSRPAAAKPAPAARPASAKPARSPAEAAAVPSRPATTPPVAKDPVTSATGAATPTEPDVAKATAPAAKPAPTEVIPVGNEPGTLTCTPQIRVIEVRRPIPFHCTQQDPSRPPPARMEVTYRDHDSVADWLRLPMKPVGDAFEAIVSCEATQKLGQLDVLIHGYDAAGQEIEYLGDPSQPLVFQIRQQTSADPPRLPGKPPPPQCEPSEQCPPGMPGCAPEGGSPRCEEDEDCSPGVCEDGKCKERSCRTSRDCAAGTQCLRHVCTEVAPPRHRLSATVGADAALAGGENVCRAREGGREFGCFLPGTDQPYRGIAQEDNAGSTNRAFLWGTFRVLLAYEYLAGAHWTVGGRAGWALRGEPKFEKSRFIPIHLEARAQYFPLAETRLRPFVALGAGLATVDARFGVQVIDCGVPGDPDYDPTCALTYETQHRSRTRSLDAVQRFGPAFIDAGLGILLRLGARSDLRGEVGWVQFFPFPGGAVMPSLGYAWSF